MFLVVVVMLLALAALDLFVRVSNEAVNVLNAAVGTRIAPFFAVMLTACAGLLLGATFSSDMMEVARRDIFHPELFTYKEVMTIFAAVILSDVILINVFNSLGLPTSTTVAVIYELFGAAVFTAFWKLSNQDFSYSEILNYVKPDRAAAIVSVILLSVVAAFIAGMLVQFFCRLLFSFRFERTYKYLGGIFTGLALTSIAYFLVFCGARNAGFIKPEYLSFVDENFSTLILGVFLFFAAIGQLMVLLNLNVFRLIILAGTFALAFSFAGNDLVNFAGVPLAALDGYNLWHPADIPSDMFLMEGLDSDAGTSPVFLFLAGALICVSLWVSKRIRLVMRTSLNLSASAHGARERFGASAFGRTVTRLGMGLSRTVGSFLPDGVSGAVAGRYEKAPLRNDQPRLVFDYVRASVNLVVASALISLATSFRLPLSTTYVTFMVAMGTSLADGAWDRESAVYRISGIMSVVAGWFLTGFCAFTVSVLAAMVISFGGMAAVLILFPAVFGLVFYGNFIRKNRSETRISALRAQSGREILKSVSEAVPDYFDNELSCIESALRGCAEDNVTVLRRARNKAHNIMDAIAVERGSYYSLALDRSSSDPSAPAGQEGKSGNKGPADSNFFFYHVFTNMLVASRTVHDCADYAYNHVAARHAVPDGMHDTLCVLLKRMHRLSYDLKRVCASPDAKNAETVIRHARKLSRDVNRSQTDLLSAIGKEYVSMHASHIYLTFLQALRDMAGRYTAVAMLERALSELVSGGVKVSPDDPLLKPAFIAADGYGAEDVSGDSSSAFENADIGPENAGASASPAAAVTEQASLTESPAPQGSAPAKD